jgi:cytochrome b6-f complex iron-sulfur subunit
MDESTAMPRPACAGCSAKRPAGVDRRAFLSAATLAAAAALLEACGGITGVGYFTGPSGGPLSVKLSSFSALASVGGVARVDNGNGAPTALVRTGTSSFLGVTMVCSHQGATINVNGSGFLCPNHGARFGSTGLWQGGQGTSSLATYKATYDGVDTVTIARP